MAEWRDVQGDQQENIPTSPLFLAIDQGGHASRALVFDQSGRKVVESRRMVDVTHPQSSWVEQDADALVQSIQSALGEVVTKLGERRQFLVSAGLVTQRSNIVCWDRNTGRALSPAISWQDRRAHHWMQAFGEHADTIRRITGLVPSAHYGASKIHWCLEHLEEVAAARAQGTLACGPLASFLLFRLLKERPFVVDSVNASRTLLWDRVSRDWSDDLLSLFSLADDYLPRCVPNSFEFGNLELGDSSVPQSIPFSVPFFVPMTVCSGDQSAALFSQGEPKMNDAYLNMGTGAFMQSLSKRNETSPVRLLQSVVWDEPGESLQVLEATVNGAGSALSIVEKELGISSKEAQRQYANWLETAKNIPLYLNGISGLGSPFWQADFVSGFVGDGAEVSMPEEKMPEEKMVAVMESILFLITVNLEELRDESVDVQRIVISGGLSVLDGLCQRLADVSGLIVFRPAQSEASARGLSFLLVKTWMKTTGTSPVKRVDVEWSRENTMESKTDKFLPTKNKALAERYQRWRVALDKRLNKEACV